MFWRALAAWACIARRGRPSASRAALSVWVRGCGSQAGGSLSALDDGHIRRSVCAARRVAPFPPTASE
eukprot:8622359-Pyramimonas_sp.AAC.1